MQHKVFDQCIKTIIIFSEYFFKDVFYNNSLFNKNSPKITLWVSLSALNSHLRLKMSVDSESTH
jgi:hypothetical protein